MLPGLTLHNTLVLIFASYLVLTNLLFLWVALGNAHWFFRAMAVFGAVALFVPPGMGEVAILTLFLAGIIVGPCRFIPGFFAWRAARYHFGIVDIMLLVVPVAVSVVIAPHLQSKLPLLYLFAVATLFALQAMALAWLVLGNGWLHLRVVTATIAVVGTLLAIWRARYFVKPVADWLPRNPEESFDTAYLFCLAFTLLIAGELFLCRSVRQSTNRRTQRLLGGIAVAAILTPLFFVDWTYFRCVTPLRAPGNHPVPNQVARVLDRSFPQLSSWLNQPDPQRDSDAVIARWIENHQQEIDSLRSMLADPAVRWEDAANTEFDRLGHRYYGLLLLAHSKPPAQQAEIGRDLVRLGGLASQGAHWQQAQGALHPTRIGIEMIHESLGALTPEECARLLAELQDIDSRWPTSHDLNVNTRIWLAEENGWPMRVQWAALEICGHDSSIIFPGYEIQLKRTIAHLRLLQVELALRSYYLEHNRYPEALAELTPEFLAEVPLDPFSSGPLLYRLDGEKYLLYSVGPDGKDHGGGVEYPGVDLRLGSLDHLRGSDGE